MRNAVRSIAFVWFMGVLSFQGHAADLTFSPLGGPHPSSVSVSIANSGAGSEVRYTTNGSIPTATSTLYTTPIPVSATTVIRAAAFTGGTAVGEIVTDTYLINVNTSIPIMSIVMAPRDLDPHNVLTPLNRSNPYANSQAQVHAAAIYWNSFFFSEQQWQSFFNTTDRMGERLANVSYWETGGVKAFQADTGMRMHGGASRQNDTMKKSFRFYFRSEYGPGKLDYKIFATSDVARFDKLVFRGNYNDGWSHSKFPSNIDNQTTLACYIRDPLTRALRREMGDLAGHDAWCMVYLNGEPWGLYNTTERYDDNWLKDYTGKTDWDLIGISDVGATGNDKDPLPHGADEVKEGDAAAWQSFVTAYVTNGTNANPSGLTGNAYLAAVQNHIDIENFTNYMILNIWNGNCDWPHHNAFVARERTAGAKWIFIDWDTESAYGGGGAGSADVWGDGRAVNYNAMARCTDQRMRFTNLLRQLLGSPDYRNYFAQRMDILLNSILAPSHINARADEMAADIRPAMPFEKQVWQQVHTVDTWETALVTMKTWNSDRTPYVRQHVRDHALMPNVTGWADVTIAAPPTGGGRVKVQTLEPESYPMTGTFFTGVPLTLEAIPDTGYVFSGWTDGDPSGATRTFTHTGPLSVSANFTLDGEPPHLLAAEFGRGDLIALDFDRALDPATALIVTNYSVDEGVGNPIAVSLKRDDTRVLLEFASRLSSGVLYTVTVSGLRDALLNPVMPAPETAQAHYQTPPISITEIMYNCRGANDIEWIELLNTTNSPIDASGWYISDDDVYPATGEGQAVLPASTVIQPGERVIVNLWNSPDFALWQMPENVRVINALCTDPGSLNNGGDNIALYNAASGGILIDGSLTVEYPDKASAGYSLEKVDERFPWGSAESNRYNFEEAQVAIGFPTGPSTLGGPLCDFASPGRANGTLLADTTPPEAPTITTNGGNDYATDATALLLEGACTADTAAIHVNGSTTGVTYAAGQTTWSYSGTLTPGPNTFSVTAIDEATNVSPPAVITITLNLFADTDGDGLSDEDEIYVYHTDPTLWDTDGDGYSDKLEVTLGADPLSPITVLPSASTPLILGAGLVLLLIGRNRLRRRA